MCHGQTLGLRSDRDGLTCGPDALWKGWGRVDLGSVGVNRSGRTCRFCLRTVLGFRTVTAVEVVTGRSMTLAARRRMRLAPTSLSLRRIGYNKCIGDRIDRRLAKWDASNAATMRRQNERAGRMWEEFNERDFPGPAWAYAISNLPVVGFLGALVISSARRAQGRRARSNPN